MKKLDREGLVRVTEAADPPLFLHCGERFVSARVPEGTRVIYPRPPLDGVRGYAAIREKVVAAIDRPVGSDPLSARLRPGMRVTIAFDDLSLPLPPMQRPDIRQVIIETLLERLAAAGVEDIHLIVAVCLHRHMTGPELRAVLGPKVFKAYWPKKKLYNYDAEDPAENVILGQTPHGEVVEVSKRAAESDLLIYVNINLVTMDGGSKSVAVGLGTYRTVRHHHNVHTLMHSNSYMDPPNSALARSCDRQGKIVNEKMNVFHIETTLNSDTFPHFLGFLQKPETEWGAWDGLNAWANRAFLACSPLSLNRDIFFSLKAPYAVTGIHAGQTDLVHAKTLENIHRQQLVEVEGQADVLIVGIPYVGPYNVYSIMNPILVYCMGLGYLFNFYRGKPLVKKGGTMIFLHPLEYKFNPIHHPSYIDFFDRCLPETRVPAELERKYEAQYAENSRYIDLYRFHNAYHGVHTFYMWYWGCHGMDHVGQVIAVNPASPEAAARLGWQTAPALDRAIEMAKEKQGRDAKITVFHVPPIAMCDVK